MWAAGLRNEQQGAEHHQRAGLVGRDRHGVAEFLRDRGEVTNMDNARNESNFVGERGSGAWQSVAPDVLETSSRPSGLVASGVEQADVPGTAIFFFLCAPRAP